MRKDGRKGYKQVKMDGEEGKRGHPQNFNYNCINFKFRIQWLNEYARANDAWNGNRPTVQLIVNIFYLAKNLVKTRIRYQTILMV